MKASDYRLGSSQVKGALKQVSCSPTPKKDLFLLQMMTSWNCHLHSSSFFPVIYLYKKRACLWFHSAFYDVHEYILIHDNLSQKYLHEN